MSTDDKFGIADRLRDSALLIKEQIGGEDGEAVYLDLELMADEIEEMESSFDDRGRENFLTFQEGPNSLQSLQRQMLNRVVDEADTSLPQGAQEIVDEGLEIIDKLKDKKEDET